MSQPPQKPVLVFMENIFSLFLSFFFSLFLVIHVTVQFSSVQSLSCVWLFATPWIEAHQASLSITNSWSSLRLTSIESVMPSSQFILCRPILLLPPIPPSIRVFSNESTLHMRWPKYWSFSFSIIPSKELPALSLPKLWQKKELWIKDQQLLTSGLGSVKAWNPGKNSF